MCVYPDYMFNLNIKTLRIDADFLFETLSTYNSTGGTPQYYNLNTHHSGNLKTFI